VNPVGLVDQGFLWLERRHQPMHVGGLMLFTPPEEQADQYAQRFAERARAAKVPQSPFNRKLVRRMGVWFWEEDTEFDIEAHFWHLSLPRPGRIRELLALVSQLHGMLLDRAKPLWEAYLIEGVEGGRVALYTKIHHGLVDGVAAMRLLQRALSEDPAARTPLPWEQPPRRRRTDVAGEPAEGAGSGSGGALAAVAQAAREQVDAIPTVARELMRSFRARGRDPDHVSADQAPRSLLNQRVSGSRRFAAQSWSLERVRAAGKAHDVTINDIILAMCAAALRAYLRELDALPDKPLVAMVPMSIRRDDSDSGNQVGMVLANLATHIEDPKERLATISRSVKNSKDRFAKMSQTEILSYLGTSMAVSGLNMATGLVPERQSFNLVISNVPGPRQPLYFDGARLDGIYPVSIVLDGQALNITVLSNVDKLEFGLVACRRTLPHMQKLLTHLEQGLRELEA
jgi:diacylglycerol O-acyltransferase / wax synthase